MFHRISRTGIRATRCMTTQANTTLDAFIVHAAGPQMQGGMMESITGTVSKHGGDILSSRATLLGRDFSMMLVVKVPKDSTSDLEKALSDLEKVKTCIHPATAPDVQYTLPHKHSVKVLRLTGHDATGIVASITEYFAKKNVRVLNLASEMAAAPFTDDPMFKLRLVLDLPAEMTEDEIEEGIDAVAKVLNVDLWLESMS
eukprot:TRINITY_DN8154_c0_g4_i1.p1 TRINITY_DN8154_c0_g4~~TRINITY_DN8154_c0_g4_i1.p1  ORF type:complete len:215 (+),score=47.99 TRINITY_DN8154_c0_g4_i1:48-647(+)